MAKLIVPRHTSDRRLVSLMAMMFSSTRVYSCDENGEGAGIQVGIGVAS